MTFGQPTPHPLVDRSKKVGSNQHQQLRPSLELNIGNFILPHFLNEVHLAPAMMEVEENISRLQVANL